MRRRLRRLGYDARIFYHLPWFNRLPIKGDQLNEFAKTFDADTVHFVGHSLGGIITLQMFEDHPKQKPGRVLTFGAPIHGTQCGRRVRKIPLLGKLIVGWCMGYECEPRPRTVPKDREVAGIAGNCNWGTGSILRVERDHDGIVRVDEALHDDMDETLVMNVEHVLMLISKPMFGHVVSFLRTGKLRSE